MPASSLNELDPRRPGPTVRIAVTASASPCSHARIQASRRRRGHIASRRACRCSVVKSRVRLPPGRGGSRKPQGPSSALRLIHVRRRAPRLSQDSLQLGRDLCAPTFFDSAAGDQHKPRWFQRRRYATKRNSHQPLGSISSHGSPNLATCDEADARFAIAVESKNHEMRTRSLPALPVHELELRATLQRRPHGVPVAATPRTVELRRRGACGRGRGGASTRAGHPSSPCGP